MEWKRYETEIHRKLGNMFPELEVKGSSFITGIHSKVSRQIDVLLKGKFGFTEIIGVVECKHFLENVDVKIVDSFIGFLEDVGAKVGVIITMKGFSKGAINRARGADIQLEVINYDDLGLYALSFEFCDYCVHSKGKDNFIWYDGTYAYIDDYGIAYCLHRGRCSTCNTIYIKCDSCGVNTPIHYQKFGSTIPCEGDCGLYFNLQHFSKVKSRITEYEVVVLSNFSSKVISF
ncbi:hypothetical protein A8F94_14370 [Bacillus sp. FJAT-27225]|uniref:restriction endonuclease n=1 Tax=Bacillus sp. FJAT-27225 TaxID=1743144 RepID=UPI00080C3223|nr:restriction endonuclease [Bacillus sp. FJAT-27225]OCA86025.1 hypothetical protein A8F94_14370 [Bacillus sp. FJAT-27225]